MCEMVWCYKRSTVKTKLLCNNENKGVVFNLHLQMLIAKFFSDL